MSVNSKSLASWGMSLLLAVASVATLSGDRRLVDAMKNRDQATVRALLQQRVDVNTPQGDGATALHWAAHWEDVETANLLIRAGANVNAANDYRITPLALACANGNAAIVETLVKAGANANAAMANGVTVLMRCARTGNVPAVNALLAHGADVQGKDSELGQTALMWAAANRHAEVVRTLIDRGADVQARTTGLTAAEAAAEAKKRLVVLGNTQAASLPGGISKPRGERFTPVLFAARAGARDVIEVLLAKGANVNDTAADGSSVLHVAMLSGHWDLASWLLEHGANPNADGPGYTPLHWAVGSWPAPSNLRKYGWVGARGPGKLELVHALLAHGANPNARMSRGLGGGGGVAALRLAGATAFVTAGTDADVRIMRALLAVGADPRLTTTDGTTALLVVAGFGKGPRTVEQEPYSKALEATQLAVELGIDINAANRDGETALHGTAYYGADAVAQFLVDHGAKVNQRNRLGLTAMTVAQGFGGGGGVMVNPGVVAVLRKLGGVGDVDMAATPIADIRAPCPGLELYFNLDVPAYDGRLWVSTNPATQYTNGTCADMKAGTTVRIKGVRETEKAWDGSVLATEIQIVK